MRTAAPRPSARPSRSPRAVSSARAEAVFALLRAAVLLSSAGTLAVAARAEGVEPGSLAGPVQAHVAASVVALLVVLPLMRLHTPRQVRAAAVVGTALDVVLYAGLTVTYHDVVGAASLFGIYVLLIGPVRWGWRGAVVTGSLVGAVASVWPQVDAQGGTLTPAETWLLVALFACPAAVVATVVRRGSARLRQSQELFGNAFEHASTGMALLDSSLRVVRANRAMGALFGVEEAALLGSPLALRVPAPDRERLVQALSSLAADHPGARLEVALLREDGAPCWGLVGASYLSGESGVPAQIVMQVENVTDRRTAETRLSHLATHDTLTGLPNRAFVQSSLEVALDRGAPVAVLFLDLDRFKVVNDGLGHAAGDRLLEEVGRRLSGAIRPGDVVGRLGGDEFVVVCALSGDDDRATREAVTVAERALAALREPVQLDGLPEFMGATVGVAVSREGVTAGSLIGDADTAMYAGKAAGGGRVAVFTPALRAAAVSAHELEVDLRQAIADDGLHLAYQPVVDLVTGRVEGLEALVRWTDARRGAVPAAELVAVAEQSDLVVDLGRWVLRRALRDLRSWSDRVGRVPVVAVNVSLRQLLDPRFPAHVAAALTDAGVPADRLCLEVTETALGGDVEEIVAALGALRDVGVVLAIDDFGTGHASLTYLARFPVDVVKVDRSFVAGCGTDAGSASIVGGVVAMAHTFGMRVVAEGAETQEQLDVLGRLGCDRVQGFITARPMPADRVLAVLDDGALVAVPRPRTPEGAAELRERADEASRYRLLLDGARDITACLDVPSVMERAFVVLRRVLAFTGGSVQLVDGGVVRLAATDPPATTEALGASIPVGQGVSGGIAATGEPVYLPDITVAQNVTKARRTKSASPGVRSWYGVPLIAEGGIVGVLQVDSVDVDAFDEGDRLLLLSFAPVVASAVLSARAFSRELEAHRSGS